VLFGGVGCTEFGLRVFGLGYVFLYRPTCFGGAIWWCRMHWIWATCFGGELRVFVSAFMFLGCYLVVWDALNGICGLVIDKVVHNVTVW